MKRRALKVLQPGLLTLIQDLGRWGYQRFGLSVSGAMDQEMVRIVNRLVGNPDATAVLEMTLLGPEIEAVGDLTVAFAGGDMQPQIEGESVPPFTTVKLHSGQRLQFRSGRIGCRTYLGIAGGIATEPAFGSRSTYLRAEIGGLSGRPLLRGDVVPISVSKGEPSMPSGPLQQFLRPLIGDYELRVILGPQDDLFTTKGIEALLKGAFVVSSKSDRTGLRLEGETIEFRSGADIISDAVAIGSIQVTADGNPILMMADRNTTGGYAKIATVCSVDIGLAAQARPHDRINFRTIPVEEAQRLARARRQQLDALLPKVKTIATTEQLCVAST